MSGSQCKVCGELVTEYGHGPGVCDKLPRFEFTNPPSPLHALQDLLAKAGAPELAVYAALGGFFAELLRPTRRPKAPTKKRARARKKAAP